MKTKVLMLLLLCLSVAACSPQERREPTPQFDLSTLDDLRLGETLDLLEQRTQHGRGEFRVGSLRIRVNEAGRISTFGLLLHSPEDRYSLQKDARFSWASVKTLPPQDGVWTVNAAEIFDRLDEVGLANLARTLGVAPPLGIELGIESRPLNVGQGERHYLLTDGRLHLIQPGEQYHVTRGAVLQIWEEDAKLIHVIALSGWSASK